MADVFGGTGTKIDGQLEVWLCGTGCLYDEWTTKSVAVWDRVSV